MIDHFNLPVANVDASRAFYDRVLGQLGFGVIAEDGDAVGYGTDAWSFGLVPSGGQVEPIHLAFQAKTREQVDAFFASGLANGGQDNGAPGERPEYGAAYYACFLIDPDGHNVEAVMRG